MTIGFVRTFTPKTAEITRDWYIVDAAGETLGRVATEVAILLRGKHKPTFAPHADVGDHVIIINAKDIIVTGNKATDKMYVRHSQYPGGFRQVNFRDRMVKHPTAPLYDAIKGMLPHTRLGRTMLTKLRVYPDAEHPHQAQNPKEYKLQYHSPNNDNSSK